MAINKKPIAVLCLGHSDGLTYLLARFQDNVVEYSTARKEVITTDGQQYLLVCNEEELRGIEFSDFIIAPGFGKHQYAEQLRQLAETRIR